MTIFVVTTGLNKMANEITNRIASVGDSIAPFSGSWLVVTDKSAKEVYELLTIGFAGQQLILIAELGKSHFGNCSSGVWDWIKDHTPESA